MNTDTKKWMPFSSLTEQSSFLKQMKLNRLYCNKPILSDEQKEDINYILTHYLDRNLKVFYYDKYIRNIEGIAHLDLYNQLLIIGKTKINLQDITSILVK